MIKLPSGVTIEEIPFERRCRSTLKGLLIRIRKLYEAVEDHFGEEGLRLIQEVSTEYGREIAVRVRKHQNKMDIHQVGLYLVRIFNGMQSDGEITEWQEDRVAIRVPMCPYPFTRPEICRVHTAMEEALVKGLNPELDYVIEKCIPRGDEACLHVIKRRDQVGGRKRESSNARTKPRK